MSLAKKVLSVGIASIMAMSAMGISATALAEPINSVQSATSISLNESKTVTLKYGDIGNYDDISEDTVYYKFTAPTTNYYEFTLTGYKTRTDNNDPSAYIDITDEYGVNASSSGGLFNPYFNDVKSIAYLEQGKSYIINVFYSPIGTQEYNSKDYAETAITLTVSPHTHDITSVVNDGYTDYTCKRCNYSYTEFKPLPTSPTQPTQAPTSAVVKVSKPKKTKIKKAKAAKKALAVTWNKVSGVKGYQVQAATDKKFKKNKKTVTIKKQKVLRKSKNLQDRKRKKGLLSLVKCKKCKN